MLFKSRVHEGVRSSPHARGKASKGTYGGPYHRIIPACAGKSAKPEGIRKEYQDHPRMRGEKGCPGQSHIKASGSSPHARGKVFPSAYTPCGVRIIPACAGKSNGNANYNNASKDHPRMRGEKSYTAHVSRSF